MRVKDEVAGHKIRCPGCAAVLAVPQPPRDADEEALNVLLEDSPDEPPADRRRNWEAFQTPADSLQQAPRPPIPKAVVSAKPAKPKPKRSRTEPGGLFNNVEWKPWIAVPGLLTMLAALAWLALSVAICFSTGVLYARALAFPIVLFFMGGGTFFKGITRGGSID
jgi:hypothetical protein